MKPRISSRRRHHSLGAATYALAFGPGTPLLTVRAGETITATAIDSSGFDERNRDCGVRYNALTGPFGVEGAEPGDTLVVDLLDVRLTRPRGLAYSGISEQATTPREFARSLTTAKLYNWKLDLRRMVGSPQLTPRLRRLRLPLRPFPGCIGVAPANNETISSLYAGPFGGNVDCNQLVAGTRLYFPISTAGGLFYFGDGHAAQGDGEPSGGAIETTLALTFRLDVIHGKAPPAFRAESNTHYLAFGVGQPLDHAYQNATANAVDWLTGEFGFEPSEAYVLLGVSSEIVVANVVNGRGNTVACRLAKAVLEPLRRRIRRHL